MKTKSQIAAVLNEAGQSFERCCKTIESWKYSDRGLTSLKAIVEFQPRLAKSLYMLEHCYTQLQQEKRFLIERTTALSVAYLRRRLKTLAKYSAIINRAVDTGKIIGDSYAWLFYQAEHKLLKEHYSHERLLHSAVGVGGMGEIEFVTQMPKINHYFVLYHGITTFLRLGDISLIDTRTMAVAGIAELKSHKISETEIRVNVTVIGPKIALDAVPSGAVTPIRRLPEIQLNAREAERLKRQINRIRASFKVDRSRKTLDSSDVSVASNYHALSELHRKRSTRRCSTAKVGPGLLLVGIQLRKRTFADSLLATTKMKFFDKLEGMSLSAREIVDRSLPDNSIEIGFIPYATRSRYTLSPGMQPLLWWPLARGVANDLLFQRFVVTTLFNPAFLVDRLRRSGLTVASDAQRNLIVTKAFRDGQLRVHGMERFISNIQRYLIPEEGIVQMVENLVKGVEASPITTSTVIPLDVNYRFD